MNKTLAAAAVLCTLAATPLARAEITADQVRKSIDQAVSFLEREQRRNGTWTDHAGFVGGVTALCTLALLNAGLPPDDERIESSIGYLRSAAPQADVRRRAANHGIVHGATQAGSAA